MSERIEKIKQIREEKYQPLEERIFDPAEEILEKPLDHWWFRTMLLLKRSEKSLEEEPEKYPTPIRGFLSDNLGLMIETLRQEVEVEAETTKRAHDVIFDISKRFMEPEPEEKEGKLEIFQVTIDGLVDQLDRVSYTQWQDDQQRKAIAIENKSGKKHLFPLPDSPNIFHKGGFPRVLLKLFVGSPEETIEPELPPNDFDIIAISGVKEIKKKIEEMEIEPDGVEYVEEKDWQKVFQQRDLDMNGCVVGENTLIFSSEAAEAAKSGKITIKEAKRGIYGTEHFYYDGERLLKNRGMMRLIKTVAEGKAIKFEFTPLNKQVNLGIYWLILTRKYMNKPNTYLLLDKTFYLAKQMGQVEPDENNVIDTLNRVHEEYPFLNLEGPPLDEEGVARWLGKKLIKQIDSYYRHTRRIPNDLVLDRQDGDREPYTVNMEGYKPDQEKLETIQIEFEMFLNRCQERRLQYLEEEG
jgi:hypothetical protein